MIMIIIVIIIMIILIIIIIIIITPANSKLATEEIEKAKRITGKSGYF